MADPKNEQKSLDPTNVSSVVLAKLLGLSAPVVSKLFQSRTILQNGRRGKYDLFDAVPRYIQSIRTSGTAEAGEKLKIQQERKLRLANDAAAGSLVKVDDAAEVFRAACIAWRAGASAIPRRLATELSNTTDAVVVRERIADEIADLYTEFEKPLREYFGAAFDTGAPVKPRVKRATPAAKKKPGRMGGRKPNTTARKRRTRKMAK